MYVLTLVVTETVAKELTLEYTHGFSAELSHGILLILDLSGILTKVEVQNILKNIKQKYGKDQIRKNWIQKFKTVEDFSRFCLDVNKVLTETTEEDRKVLEEAGIMFN